MLRRRILCHGLSLILLFSLGGCGLFRGVEAPTEGPEQPTVEPTGKPTETPMPTDADPIEELMGKMSLREKVGQLFIVRPNAFWSIAAGEEHTWDVMTELTNEVAEAMEDYPVGGVAMFWQNISGPEQIKRFIADLQSASAIPLFVGVDEEGGSIARLANNSAFRLPKYENAAAVGESGDPHDAELMGRTIGAYLTRFGFNLDFAPVADVNTNPKNPVIGTRAFSQDPVIAAKMAAAMALGLREEGIIPTFKHFPGHGDTAEDSHLGVALSGKTREEMASCEWLPFLEAGPMECVMVGHITTPGLTDDGLPATLSYEVVTNILRGDLDFQGLVLTDALEMGAIVNEYGCGTSAVMAVKAGCDILLMPLDFQEAFDAVLRAVESGEISEERIDESVRRILAFKSAYLAGQP